MEWNVAVVVGRCCIMRATGTSRLQAGDRGGRDGSPIHGQRGVIYEE